MSVASPLQTRPGPGTRPSEVYSHDGPIRRRKHGYILTTDQSDAGNMDICSRWTNHWVQDPSE
eukprot:5754910-Pyramimonas_sp.AAC.1